MKSNFLYKLKIFAINRFHLSQLCWGKFCLFFSDNINLENKLFNKMLKINKLNPKWAVFCAKFLKPLLKKSLKVIKNR